MDTDCYQRRLDRMKELVSAEHSNASTTSRSGEIGSLPRGDLDDDVEQSTIQTRSLLVSDSADQGFQRRADGT